MAMRNRIITNLQFHDPDCDSINLESKLMFYTDVIISGNLDSSEYDNNLKKIMEVVTPLEIAMAYPKQKSYFIKLYYQSEKDNYFWEYCPFQVYLNTFEFRRRQYFIGSKDSINRDFYIYELCELCEIEEEYIIKINSPKFDFSNFYRYPKRIRIDGNSGATFVEYKQPFFKPVIEDTQKRKIEYIISLLNNESFVNPTNIEKTPEVKDLQDFLEIFVNDGYDLFNYLNDNYTIDNNSPKAKYSFIYHFLKYNSYLLGQSQSRYLFCINKYHQVKLSRVQRPNDKYDDYIKPLLSKLQKQYKQRVIEQN